MKHITKSNKTKILLLLGCAVFIASGVLTMFIGALAHVNPNVQFSSLFSSLEPLMNLVYSIFPSLN